MTLTHLTKYQPCVLWHFSNVASMPEPQGSSTAVAVMLPPSAPSERSRPPSSLDKRKRGKGSVAGSSVVSASTSTGFAPSVKDKVEHYNGGFQCWHCNAPKPHICHVIGRRERVVRRAPIVHQMTSCYSNSLHVTVLPRAPSPRSAQHHLRRPS